MTAENVDDLIQSQGFSGPVDLLSLDIDGNDYWVWKAIDAVQPRVVVLEFPANCGPDRRVTIAYDPDFRLDMSQRPYRCGASLSAFAALGRLKGYRLVGVQSLGINAFFVRQGLAEDLLPAVTVRECYERSHRLAAWQTAQLESLMAGSQKWQDV